MKRTTTNTLFTIAISLATILSGDAFGQDRLKTANGVVEGTLEQSSGIRSFKGIPFASPPVGDLRWPGAPTHPVYEVRPTTPDRPVGHTA